MKRRFFLKGLLGAWTGISTYFSFKYFKNQNILDKNEENKNINTKINFKRKATGVIVEFPIVHHCNLNCAYCDHFSSIAPVYKISVEDFKKDARQLSKITKGELNEIWILGGEPLLHDKLPEIFKIAHNAFPKTNIKMLTNGLLLDKQSDDFWQSCTDNNIKIVVENYIYNKDKINYNVVVEKLKKYHCLLSFDEPKYNFRQMNLKKEKVHDASERYKQCKCKLWPILDNGKFYSCSVINGVEKFFNKKFPQYAIPVSKNDVLDIHKINSIDEIIEFYNKPKEMCAHCNYFLTEGKKWRLSKREVDEWYQK